MGKHFTFLVGMVFSTRKFMYAATKSVMSVQDHSATCSTETELKKSACMHRKTKCMCANIKTSDSGTDSEALTSVQYK